MEHLKLPVGVDSFEKIRKENYYYIDKSGFITALLKKTFEVNLITRPRRFGKTLNMSMLADFLDITKDSRENFRGLEVEKEADLCLEWRNQWAVLFLSLKSVDGLTFESAYAQLQSLISDCCIKFSYLQESQKISEFDRMLYDKLMLKNGTQEEVCNSLFTLTRMLHAHFGKQVVLLIDEYDVPLAKASEHGYYVEMLDIIRSMLGKALKTNEFLKFSVITGCLRIAKESIFTGTNNNEKFEMLLSGKSIWQKVTEDLTYDVLHSSEDNLWSILYLTGYLTQNGIRRDMVSLKIPNEEVKTIFTETIAEWFKDTLTVGERQKLFAVMWNGETEKATEQLSDILFETISYHDYDESYYHAFLAGIFAGADGRKAICKRFFKGVPGDSVLWDCIF